MKNVFYFWMCMAVWLLSACSSQKKGDGEDVQVLMKDSVDANGLQRMQVSDSKMSFTYNAFIRKYNIGKRRFIILVSKPYHTYDRYQQNKHGDNIKCIGK